MIFERFLLPVLYWKCIVFSGAKISSQLHFLI